MKKSEKRQKSRETIRKVIRLVHRLCPSFLPLMIVSQMLCSAIPFVNIIFSSMIIDELVAESGYEEIFSYALWLVILNGVLVLAHQGLEKFVNVRAYSMMQQLWGELANKALVMDYELLEKKDTMDNITRAKVGMQSHGGLQSFCQTLAKLAGIVINIVYSVILMIPVFLPVRGESDSLLYRFFNSPAGAVMLAVILAVYLVILYRGNKEYGELQKKQLEDNISGNTLLGYFTQPLNTYQQGKDIRMIRLDIPYIKRYKTGAKRLIDSMFTLAKAGNRLETINSLYSSFFTVACYVYVGIKALLGMITVGNVARYVSAFTKFAIALTDIVGDYINVKLSAEYLSYFVNFMDIENKKYDGTLPIEKRDDNEYEIEFRNVSFSYPNSEKPVIDHVSFKLKIGNKMALVGPNGAGKSTFIKLLCRLYDPTEGEILLNGIDIRYYDYNEYIQLFSVVFQDFKLFSFTIAENVAVSKAFDEEKVRDCLRKAGFTERLGELEKDIHTNLFKLKEDGMEISGGEAQKIAIARALYKDSPLVILDEPTSALDPVSEYEIYRSFDRLVEEKTAIYISHRMSSCRFCNQILVFDDGKIVQMGSHDELVRDKEGLYYEMWSSQAQYYQ